MDAHSNAVQQVLIGTRYLITTSTQTGRRALALGAMLVLGSTLTVVATANTPPTITSASLNKTTINEGQSVTVSGTFTDPDASDTHTALVHWPDGEKGKAEIPAGQFTFQVSRTFPDNLDYHLVIVELRDHNLPPGANDNTEGLGKDTESLSLNVVNVAPTFAHNVAVTRARNAPGKVIVEGDTVDPGADTVTVYAIWDANGLPQIGNGQACTMTTKRHFRCEHTYAVPQIGTKTHSIKLTARDDDGAQTQTSTSVTLP